MEYYSSKVEEMRRKGKLKHQNKLSKREMESLTAICDTILPSVVVSGGKDNDDVVEFYGTSASMVDIPEKIGRLVSGDLTHPAFWQLHAALWFLSTWIGSFCMCGWSSLSKSFPYFQKFADLGQAQREKVLLSWSLSSINTFKMLFKSLKYLVARMYFSEVNEKNYNPSWKAIDYCGPDPDFINQFKHQADKTENCMGPLHHSLLDINSPIESLSRTLEQKNFPPPDTTSSILTLNCDAVVVGSGSGGSVIAGVLASYGYKVLVLEKGNYFARNNLSLIEGVTTNEMYEGRGLIATDNVGALILAGSTVGGGSTINWSASLRTPKHVRDEWAHKFKLDMFANKMYDHALDVVCEKMSVQANVDEEGFTNQVLRRGCEELGYEIQSVPCNAPSDHYCGWCHLGCKNGKKKSTQETWLKDLVESGNGLIIPGCKALKVMRNQKTATGVVVESTDSKRKFIINSKVTVVACGALNTPSLLKRSGLKNKFIGKNLHIHPTVMAWGYFPDETKKSYEGGILTSMCTTASNFDTSGYGTVLQTPSLHPGVFSVVTPWTSAQDFRERMMRFARTVHIFALARDKGTGTVDYPRNVVHYLNGEDEGNLVKGLEIILRVLVAAGAEEVGTTHCNGERVKVKGNEKGLERLIEGVKKRGLRDLAMPVCSAHQMGSCRMGAGPEEGAVRPSGEAWEVDGLFVGDTSVFPTALGVNPMVTVQAVAYCTAQNVLDVLRRKGSGMCEKVV